MLITAIMDSINVQNPEITNREITTKPSLLQTKSEIVFLKEEKVIFRYHQTSTNVNALGSLNTVSS